MNLVSKKIVLCVLLLPLIFLSCREKEVFPPPAPPSAPAIRVAGFRASRILNSYPNHQFPSKEYWASVGVQMAAKFDSTGAGGIWIVSLYLDDGTTQLNFPIPGHYPYITYRMDDQNDAYLDYFDRTGLKIWLQVEPGAADIDTLIYFVLNRYKNHPCVAGFGIDGEWYKTRQYSGGKKITDAEAEHWEKKVKKVNPTYSLFLKHYSASHMPPNYRGDIIFVDDSQGFGYATYPFNEMVTEFSAWGRRFFPNPVAFQYGYPNDRPWWSKLSDPPGDIGRALIGSIPNCYGLFWVDFTISEVFPIQ